MSPLATPRQRGRSDTGPAAWMVRTVGLPGRGERSSAITMSQKPNNINRSYLYTNWRGKTFIIDDIFVDRLKKYLIEDGCSQEYANSITPESIMDDLPIYEELERLSQLEEMWEKLAG